MCIGFIRQVLVVCVWGFCEKRSGSAPMLDTAGCSQTHNWPKPSSSAKLVVDASVIKYFKKSKKFRVAAARERNEKNIRERTMPFHLIFSCCPVEEE